MKKSIEKKAYTTTVSASAKRSTLSKAKVAKPKKAAETQGLKKQYLKSNEVCKVTFRLPKDAAPNANMVTLVGDFNNWNSTANKMKKLKNGDFTLTLDLTCNREYRFRYLIDANRWENDWFADKYVLNDFGTEDSVLVI